MSERFWATKKTMKPMEVLNVKDQQFQALAIELYKKIKANMRISEVVLKPIVDKLYTLLENQDKPNAPFLSKSSEHLSLFIDNTRPSSAIYALERTLRDLAVDEFLEHPTDYPEVFHSLHAKTSEDYLRQETTPLPLGPSLVALAEKLKITIPLSITHGENSLRSKIVYCSKTNDSLFTLALRQKNNHFVVEVEQGAFSLHTKPLITLHHQTTENNLEPIFEQLKVYNLKKKHTFNHWRHILSTTFIVQLQELYIHTMEQITPYQESTQPPGESYQKGVERCLIDTLAMALTQEQISPDLLDEYREETFSMKAP